MTGLAIPDICPSGQGVRRTAGNVCCGWAFGTDTKGTVTGPIHRGRPNGLGTGIGRGSKLRIAAVSTGAGDGTGGIGERQFADAPNESTDNAGGKHRAESRA